MSKILKVQVEKMIDDTDNVESVEQLAELLRDEKKVNISERTLYNWKSGKGFQSLKLSEVADKLGYENPLELIVAS